MRKKYFFFFLIIQILFLTKVNAIEYEMVRKRDLIYEINGFYIEGDYLKINGWAISDGNMQNYFDDSTHSYSIFLQNVNNNNDKLYYDSTLLPADKTILFKYESTTKSCSSTAINRPPTECYMIIRNVGFQFNIPLSDLKKDTSYNVILRMYNKQANIAYQTYIFAPNISEFHEKDGIRYELDSDYSTTNIVVLSNVLFVKEGPSTSSRRLHSYKSCSTGTTLYWKQYETFTNLQETSKTTNDYSSETWFRVLFDQGVCIGGRSRAFMGYSYTGWLPSVYTDFEGTPATIKITTQNHSSIDEIRTYTSPINNQTKAIVKLYNKVNQNVNVKLYQNNILMYDNNITFNGIKELTIPFKHNGGEDIKVIIKEPSGYETILKSKIYKSNYNQYTSDLLEINITPSTPIIVIANKTETKNIYERIKVSIPYNHINIISGKPIQTWSYIEYFTDNNEVILNSNISGNVLFPTQESTLNYQIKNNKVLVNTIKTDSNSNQAIMNLPEYVLDKNKGSVYEKGKQPNNIATIYGDRKWYTPISDPLGTYNYQINLGNLGVNRVSVSFNCSYTTTKSLFGADNSYYVLKRTYIPDNPIYRFSKKYTYDELLQIGGN